MYRFIVWLTLCSFLGTQSAALAQSPAHAHTEGTAAGQAANTAARPAVGTASATAVAPGYTTTPPERSLYGRSDLGTVAGNRLVACAHGSGDPVCEAQLNAASSATLPHPTVSPHDPAISAAAHVTANPGLQLEDLASYYRGCSSASGPPPSSCPSGVFCFAGSCFSTSYSMDADFARAMSFMEAAREAGVYLDPHSLRVFTGEVGKCRNRLLKNCCQSDSAGAGMSNQSLFGLGSRLVFDVLMSSANRQFLYQGLQALLLSGGFSGSFTTYGVTVAINGTALPAGSSVLYAGDSMVIAFDPWSLAIAVVLYVALSLASCNQDEGRLAMQEGAHLCHTVGTYCSSCIRILGKCVACIERTTGKCCFNSVLSRIVNEQGRNQLGRGWGSGEAPDCTGFSVNELQSLNFSTMDLTEFYASIVPTLPSLGSFQRSNAARVPSCYYGKGRC
ncbi:conjugal transfer protein TraN [Roseateles flavus]|uniref:Conjugal transfer protein TraN n=1 Tax=Roseateles flavus TaxID=3149041 RepID=A0ABV0GKP6_9BURK